MLTRYHTKLTDVLITDRLALRNKRIADWRLEATTLHSLAAEMSERRADPLVTLVEMTTKLTGAGSAGLSMLEELPCGEVFRWQHLTGSYRRLTGGTMPRHHSPCGVTLDRGTPQLFQRPERFFHYERSLSAPVVEALIVPVFDRHQALGTIWVVAHDDETQFDMEDVRLMEALATFVVRIRRNEVK